MSEGVRLLPAVDSPDNETRHICIDVVIGRQSKGIEESVKMLLLEEVLDFVGGDKAAAATILGLSPKTIYNRLNAALP
ncbi:MAG: hypothetical protein G01um101425_465 [Candidatus Peregrinibacteria bacterium Gr01-1014_25]|nr:MAG: hypothetical protein G01um101425_465 [Candidatus Peregrinibacteria bacterium Gr01-1014_25]